MQQASKDQRQSDADDRPPFGRSWGFWYAAVLGNLVLLIALFTWLTRAYSGR